MILRYEETLVQDNKCPAGSAGSVHKAPRRIWWAIRFSNCLPASDPEHLPRPARAQSPRDFKFITFCLKDLRAVPPALTEPVPASVAHALAGSWLLIPVYETQSLPSPFAQLHLAAHSMPFGPPQLFQTKLIQTVPTCGCRPRSPFPAANDSPTGAI